MGSSMKCRAWDYASKSFIYHELVHGRPPKGEFTCQKISSLNAWKLSDWQEFTGLRDKIGTEIYEDDIIHVERLNGGPEIIAQVFWKQDICAFALLEQGKWHWALCATTRNKLTVIGNSYENPELLK